MCSSRKVLKRQILSFTKEMDDLMEQGIFTGGYTLYDHGCSSVPLVTTELKGKMFKENLRLIMSWLTDHTICRIGVYGLGGVGKTTLAMHIHNELHEYIKTSVHVYWVTVSQEHTIYNLQNKIAKAANVDHVLQEEDEMKRAAMLSAALKTRKKVVLFLDDMWKHFSLEKVGIPIGKSQCKLIITSRSLDVCRRMNCQKQVKVEPVYEKESWELFAEKLGNVDELSLKAREVAKLVAKKCSGLPLAILTIAGSMAGVADDHEWSNALEEVTNSTRHHEDMESQVFPLLELSYARLNDVNLQKCFLCCALYPEDSKLGRSELIHFWVSNSLLEEIESREKQIDKAHTILNRLINTSLLETLDSRGEYVKMHDLIRDMAINIGRDKHRFMIRAGQQLAELPDDREWTQDLKTVSLISNYISEIPPSASPLCPHLSTLLLEDNPIKSIPDLFFLHLKSLCFLKITQARIEKLPDCISDLENLSALEVRNCIRLGHLPSLAKLKKLRVLDNRDNYSLKEIPIGSNGLPNLRFLSLTGCDGLCVPFHQLVSGLPRIECLELGYCVTGVLAKDLMKVERLAKLDQCWISDVSEFHSYVQSRHYHKLRYYRFYIGTRRVAVMDVSHPYDKVVVINGVCLNKALELPDNVQFLQVVHGDTSIRNLLDVIPSLLGLTRLLRIWVGYCDGLDYVFPSISSSIVELRSLEELNLSELSNFKGIMKPGTLPNVALHNLTKLTVEYCHSVRKLVTLNLLNELHNLQVLDIQVCGELEEIIAASEDAGDESGRLLVNTDQVRAEALYLPRLRNLQLVYLKSLVSICSGGLLGSDHIEEIIIISCPKLSRIPLGLPLLENGQPHAAPRSRRRLLVEREWWERLQWDHPHSRQVLQPYVEFSETC